MIITLNGYSINDPANPVTLDIQIDGLELPPIRTSSGDYAGRDGGYVGPPFYSARVVTLQGHVFSSNVATLEQARRDFQTALRSGTIPMTILTNAGNSYLLNCKLISFQMPILRDLFRSDFKIDLKAPDPTIYDNATGTALTAAISKIISGGYTYPVVYPVIYAAASSPTTVTNAGTVDVFPTVTLTGTMTSPILTNQRSGLFVSLPTLVTGPGDIVSIDMRARTVLLNGSNIFGLVGPFSNFWSLLPGGNPIALTTTGGADTVTGVLSWRSGFMGI